MSHDQHAAVANGPDDLSHAHAPFQLDTIHPGFLVEADGASAGLFNSDLVRAEGHVADNKGVGCTPANGLCMIDALVHGDRDCSRIAVDCHSEAVADQDHVHARFLSQLGCDEIIRGDPNRSLAFLFHVLKIKSCEFLFHVPFLLYVPEDGLDNVRT